MEQMPGDVFHHGCVPREDGLSIHYLPLLWAGPDVPETDGLEDG